MFISLHACLFFVSCCHQWDPRQSLAEVEALRVRSDMLETDLKTCTSEALALFLRSRKQWAMPMLMMMMMMMMPMPLTESKLDIETIPPAKHTKSYRKLSFIVSFPLNMVISIVMLVYQRVVCHLRACVDDFVVNTWKCHWLHEGIFVFATSAWCCLVLWTLMCSCCTIYIYIHVCVCALMCVFDTQKVGTCEAGWSTTIVT